MDSSNYVCQKAGGIKGKCIYSNQISTGKASYLLMPENKPIGLAIYFRGNGGSYSPSSESVYLDTDGRLYCNLGGDHITDLKLISITPKIYTLSTTSYNFTISEGSGTAFFDTTLSTTSTRGYQTSSLTLSCGSYSYDSTKSLYYFPIYGNGSTRNFYKILFLESGLGGFTDNLPLQTTIDFLTHHPIYKDNNNYFLTSSISAAAGTPFTFLSSIGNCFSDTRAYHADGDAGHGTIKNLTTYADHRAVGNQASSYQLESIYIYDEPEDRRYLLGRYGVNGKDISVMRYSPTGGTTSLLPGFLYNDNEYDIHGPHDPKVIDSMAVSPSATASNYIFGIDRYCLGFNGNIYRIPPNGTVAVYKRHGVQMGQDNVTIQYPVHSDSQVSANSRYYYRAVGGGDMSTVLFQDWAGPSTVTTEVPVISGDFVNNGGTIKKGFISGNNGTEVADDTQKVALDYGNQCDFKLIIDGYEGNLLKTCVDTNNSRDISFAIRYRITNFPVIPGTQQPANQNLSVVTGPSTELRSYVYGPDSVRFDEQGGFLRAYVDRKGSNVTCKALLEIRNKFVTNQPGVIKDMKVSVLEDFSEQKTFTYYRNEQHVDDQRGQILVDALGEFGQSQGGFTCRGESGGNTLDGLVAVAFPA